MKKNFLRRFLLAVLVAVAATAPAQAKKKPFNVQITDATQNNASTSAGFTTVSATVDYLDPDALQALFPNGSASTDDIAALVDFRGLPGGMNVGFANNSGVLNFDVPQLGVSLQFDGSNGGGGSCAAGGPSVCSQYRKEALHQLRDYLKKNPSFLKALLTEMAYTSPIEPIAGNPDSLFSRRSRADFNYGFTNKVSQIWGCGTSAFNFTNDAPIQVAINGSASDVFRDAQARAAELQAQNEIGLGVLASNTTAKSTGGDYQTYSLELPFSYTAKLDSDPRKKIHFEFPLAYADTDGAKTYSVGLGIAYTHPLTDMWSLTPEVGVGATASPDLGSGGGVDSFSLTSAYTWRLGGMALSMGNGVGRYNSLKLKIGDVEAEADIKNTVITNGFMLTGPNSLISKNWVIEYSIVDTRIGGDKVYTDNYDEIGIAAGHMRTEMGVIDSYTKFGLSYLMARGDFDKINSLRLTLTSRF